MSPGSTGATAPFSSDSVKSPSHSSIDLTSDRNLDNNYLSAADVSRDFKPCFEKVSSSHERFTRITEREEEFKPARCGLARESLILKVESITCLCLAIVTKCFGKLQLIAMPQIIMHVISIIPILKFLMNFPNSSS